MKVRKLQSWTGGPLAATLACWQMSTRARRSISQPMEPETDWMLLMPALRLLSELAFDDQPVAPLLLRVNEPATVAVGRKASFADFNKAAACSARAAADCRD